MKFRGLGKPRLLFFSKLNSMYSTKNIITRRTEIPDDASIYKRYLGNFKLGIPISSPLRKDKNPSFCLYRSKGGRIRWKDFGTGENGSSIEFIMKYYGLSTFKETVRFLMGSDIYDTGPSFHIKNRKIKDKKDIRAVFRGWNGTIDKKYWSRYDLDIKTLSYFNVRPAKAVEINDMRILSKKNEPIYVYKLRGKYKILRPYSKMKWFSNTSKYHYHGMEQLPWIGDHLIITSSLKDVMVLYKMGFNAIAPQSETPKILRYNMLKSRFNDIIVMYDNDEAGRTSAKKLEEKGMKTMFTDHDKDISDMVERIGSQRTKEYLIKKYNDIHTG